MYNETDILARLRAGETIDDIMNEIMVVVNSAVKAKEAEDEAKRKAEEAAAWQMKDAEVVAEVLNDYFKKYCGGSGDEIDAAALVAGSKELAALLQFAGKVEDSVNEIKATIKEKAPGKPVKTVVKTGKEAEDAIGAIFDEFFKAFNI